MIRCENCGTDNLDGSEYCDECGVKIDLLPQSTFRSNRAEGPAYQPPTADRPRPARNGDAQVSGQYRSGGQPRPQGAAPVEPHRSTSIDVPLPSPPSFTTSTSIPRPARPIRDALPPQVPASEKPVASVSPEPLAPGRTLVLSSRGRTDALKSDNAGRSPLSPMITSKLVIERGGRVGREFSIATAETHIGRWDADSGIFPDVDLDQDDPEAKVSRRHARIVNQNGQYFIEDLGSTNGTFVNRGRRLLPGHRHLLQSGDEIIVGKTFLKFHIIS
jgi:hypothetical protein